MKRVHPQGRGRRPSQFPAISQGEEALISFSPHFRDFELHPRGSCIRIVRIVARECLLPQARMSKPRRAIITL